MLIKTTDLKLKLLHSKMFKNFLKSPVSSVIVLVDDKEKESQLV